MQILGEQKTGAPKCSQRPWGIVVELQNTGMSWPAGTTQAVSPIREGWLYRKPTVFPSGPENLLFKRHSVMGRKWHSQETGIEQEEWWSELRWSFWGRFSWRTWLKCRQQYQQCGDPRRRKERAPINPPSWLGGDGGCGHCLWDRLWAEILTWQER